MSEVRIRRIKGHEKEIAAAVASSIRDEDKEEIIVRGRDPYTEVLESIKISDEAFLAASEESVLCVYGIAKADEGMAIWMIATKNVVRYKKELVKYGMEYIREKVSKHPVYNYISTKNERALRFISHAGATFGLPEHIGDGTFIKFEIRR